MKTIIGIGSGLIAIAMAVGAGLGFAAQNAVAPAAITNFGNYYEDNASIFCDNAPVTCQLNFSAIPAEKKVLITHIACGIQINPGKALDIRLAIAKGNGNLILGRQDYVIPVAAPPVGNLTHYSTAGETSFLYLPGQFPVVLVEASQLSDIFVSCRIAGQRPSPL